jgi:hypothetical protein
MKNKLTLGKKEVYLLCTLLLVISLSAIILLRPSVLSSINSFTGTVVLEETEIKSKFQYIPPKNITKKGALDALLQAEDDLEVMNNSNFTVYFIKDTLLKAKRAFIGDNYNYLIKEIDETEDTTKKAYLEELLEEARKTPNYEIERLDYSKVFELTQLIAFKKEQAYRILDTISILEKKEKEYSEDKLDTLQSIELIKEAKVSFKEERYDEAEAYLEEADIKLEKSSSEYQRLKALLELSKNFFVRNWWQTLLVIAVLSAITPPLIKIIRKRSAKKKLETLKLELQTINKLMKKAQEDCFRDKKITESTYKIREERYRTRTTEIKHTIPVLEGIISGEKKKKQKKVEKKGIIEIKE